MDPNAAGGTPETPAQAQAVEAAQAQVVTPKAKKAVSKTGGDIIAETATAVEAMDRKQALSEAEKLAENVEVNYFKLGGVLHLIYTNSWFEGESFDTYVMENFGFAVRKAKYLMEIYTELVTKGIPWDKVKPLGWTKVKDLAKILTVENVDHWVGIALPLTVLQLQAVIKGEGKEATEGSDEPTTDEIVKKTFKLHVNQVETVTSALNKAKAEAKTDVDTVALEYICVNYLGSGAVDLLATMKAAGEDQVVDALTQMFSEYDVSITPKGAAA